MPPPMAEFPVKTQSFTVDTPGVEYASAVAVVADGIFGGVSGEEAAAHRHVPELKMPPPSPRAELSVKEQPITVTVPPLKMPPPRVGGGVACEGAADHRRRSVVEL